MNNAGSKKIVFSGGPNVGKISILQELKKKGYEVRSEVFTKLFSETQKENRLDALFENKEALINKLITLQYRRGKSSQYKCSKICFF